MSSSRTSRWDAERLSSRREYFVDGRSTDTRRPAWASRMDHARPFAGPSSRSGDERHGDAMRSYGAQGSSSWRDTGHRYDYSSERRPSGRGPRSSNDKAVPSQDRVTHRFGPLNTSPRKAQTGQSNSGQISSKPEGTVRDQGIDWVDIENRARANGFAVPSDIVDEFKRQGHFDTLRRSLLATFQSSGQRAPLLDSISELLLLCIAEDTKGSGKALPLGASLDALGDVRLQHAELMKLLEAADPAGILSIRKRRQGSDQPEQSNAPRTGPEILASLLSSLEQSSSETETVKRESHVEDGPIDTKNQALRSILSPSGSVGLQVTGRVQALLSEEKGHKKLKAMPSEQGLMAETEQQRVSESKSNVTRPVADSPSLGEDGKSGQQENTDDMDIEDDDDTENGGGDPGIAQKEESDKEAAESTERS